MKKTIHFLLITLLCVVLACIYGIIHDQITYTLSKDYFIYYKFEQFRIDSFPLNDIRLKVALIGVLATWWVGLIFGIIYSVCSLFLDENKVFITSIKAILINIVVTIFFGIVGFLYAKYISQSDQNYWDIPEMTINIREFINVGTIHNFGYFGGMFGVLAGVSYFVKNSRKLLY